MKEVFQTNVRLRLAHLGATWEQLAPAGDEVAANVREWVRRGTPSTTTLSRLASLLGVSETALLDPDFNPREWEAPDHWPMEDDNGDEEDSDE